MMRRRRRRRRISVQEEGELWDSMNGNSVQSVCFEWWWIKTAFYVVRDLMVL